MTNLTYNPATGLFYRFIKKNDLVECQLYKNKAFEVQITTTASASKEIASPSKTETKLQPETYETLAKSYIKSGDKEKANAKVPNVVERLVKGKFSEHRTLDTT
jgi:hypothetical protein